MRYIRKNIQNCSTNLALCSLSILLQPKQLVNKLVVQKNDLVEVSHDSLYKQTTYALSSHRL